MAKRHLSGIVAILLFVPVGRASCYASAIEGQSSHESEILQAALASTAALAGDKYLVVASDPHAAGLEREWVEAHLTPAGKVDVVPVSPKIS
jgi:hypothetical protein